MKILIALLVSLFLFCQVKAYAQQDVSGHYINSCENFGAMAVAVVYVRENKLMGLADLLTHQTEYFKKSELSADEITELLTMIAHVYTHQKKSADATLFEYYGQACIELRRPGKKEHEG